MTSKRTQALTAENVSHSVKILVVGNGSVGKSSMIRRFCRGQYNENYKKTIGVDFMEKDVDIPEFGEVRLMLWDTAGQEEFDSITREYYKDTDAVVFAFSVNDRPSFETIQSWRGKIGEYVEEHSMVLVQNKMDLASEAVISSDEAEALARELNMPLQRVSVKQYLNVEEVFLQLAERHLKKQRDARNTAAMATSKRAKALKAGIAAPTDPPAPSWATMPRGGSHGPAGPASISLSAPTTSPPPSPKKEKCIIQ